MPSQADVAAPGRADPELPIPQPSIPRRRGTPDPAPRRALTVLPRVERPAPPRVVPGAVDPDEAEDFLRQFHAETPEAGEARPRIDAVRAEIAETGTYAHTGEELAFGARVAWRNAARCIGRFYWRSLDVRDRRHVRAAGDVAAECVTHLRRSTRRGRIRSTITVFAPEAPGDPAPRVHNEQLVRYAGHRDADGAVVGDPRQVELTETAVALGWERPEPAGRFDVLPLVVTGGGEHAAAGPAVFPVPADAVLEVALTHPDLPWFADLGLRWHAVPAISNMRLDVGGVAYPAAPFNGWYMSTEIGARNLADGDRYDLLREVAEGMGLSTASDRTLWRDRAAVELTLAVQHSFDAAGVSVADHHGESERFLRHVEREERAGRRCPVDWSWIVPPISGGLTPVFHRYYDEPLEQGPMYRAADGPTCPVTGAAG